MPHFSEELSILGFGCMRLPLTTEGEIDEAKTTQMIRHAIDSGINYIDTAYPYHQGKSEPVVGRVLQDGYRDKVYLATKLPVWLVKSRDDMDKYLNEQLERLQTDHIDYYLLHALDKERWVNLKKLGFADFLNSALADGRIRHAGFSFHDDLPLFKEIVDAYPWSFCQIQYNFLDEQYQAGTEGLEYAAQKGLGVIVMEPLRGGKLAGPVPADVAHIWRTAKTQRTPAEWALRWVWNHPEVSVVLSGMTTMEQLEENLETAKNAEANSLIADELELVQKVKSVYENRTKVGCTACGYCMPCPSGVDIPGIFKHYNNASIFADVSGAKDAYLRFTAEAAYASNCAECGQCEASCPQGIPIREHLREVSILFGK